MKKTMLFAMSVLCAAAFAAAPVTVPYFTAEAVRSVDAGKVRTEAKALLAELAKELPQYEKTAGKDAVLLRRIELLKRGMAQLQRNLEAKHSPELICYAAVQLEEMRGFRDYFREVTARAARKPLPEKILNVTDFGAKGDGRTDNTEAFRKALARAMQFRGKYACTIKIPDGVFYFAEPRRKVPFRTDFLVPPEKGGLAGIRETNGYIVIGNQKDLTLAGSGKTELLFDRPQTGNVSCIKLGACDNVKVKDLSIDFKWRPFTQGTITEVDLENCSILLKTDDPQAAMPDMPYFHRGHTWSFTPQGDFQWDIGFFMMTRAEKAGPQLVRYCYGADKNEKFNPVPLAAGRKALSRLKPGMKMVHVSRYHSGGVQLDYCRFCTMENVTVYASPAMAFLDTYGYADAFNGCKILRKPGRMISSNGDGFHIQASLFGCSIVGCRGEYLYDDGINTYSRHGLVEQVLPNGNLRLSDSVPYPGSLVGCIHQKTGQIFALARYVKSSGGGHHLEPQAKLVSREMIRSGKGNGQELADSLLCFSRTGSGFVVLDTQFAHQHGKGIVIQSPNSTVENCVSIDPQQSGINLAALGNWCEYSSPHNVICRKNRTEGGKHALMIFYLIPGNGFAPCHPLRNILLEGNSFGKCRSGQLLYLHNTALLEQR